ncbi:MAG: succinic semialdehyde dehydrogenase [Halovenus sp.]
MSERLPQGYDGPALDVLAEDGAATGDRSLAVVAPFTGDTVGSVPAATSDDVSRAADRAREAQADWAAWPVTERAAVVEQFASLVLERRAALLDLIQLESGKARHDANEEVVDVVGTAYHYADRADQYMASERLQGAIPYLTRAHKHRDPHGLVGFITPWNYPLTLAVSDVLPALLAGNAVLIKPAEETPFSALFVARLLREAGVPGHCVQILPGKGEPLGEPLVASVDMIAFTGSTAVGRELAAHAGRRLIPSSLELGGSGPMVVRADAPMGRTVTGAVHGAFASTGQLCIATERIYVHESRYEEFCRRFVERVRALTLGTGFEYGPDVGPLVSAAQCSRVADSVDEAVEAGATLVTGGRRRPDVAPFAYEPTVLTDVAADSAIVTEETFGPVVTVHSVPGDDTALERANDSPYGLHGSIWTGDTARGRQLARQLDCGTVTVNDPYAAMWGSFGVPMGGTGDSGVGRRHGDEGFEKYTETQGVAVQHGHPIATPPGVPRRVVAAFLTGFVRFARRVGLR